MKPLTKKQLKKYEEASRCYICFKSFNGENPKVRDHCHKTGRYRGPAHMKCNLHFFYPIFQSCFTIFRDMTLVCL